MAQTIYDRPAVYDDYITTAIERRNFDAVLSAVQDYRAGHGNRTTLLDLCCGTAILGRDWLSPLEGIAYTGVDINAGFIDRARQYLGTDKRFKFIQADAAQLALDQKFDIVLATSAYHHIVDDRKQQFLSVLKKHLLPEGTGLIYEKLIASFNDPANAVRSGAGFYVERIAAIMKEQQLSEDQLFGLFNLLQLTALRQEEYKVPYERLVADISAAGLAISSATKLWPLDNRFGNPNVGDFVLTVRHV